MSFTKIAPDGYLHSHANLQGAISVTFGSLSIVAHKGKWKITGKPLIIKELSSFRYAVGAV